MRWAGSSGSAPGVPEHFLCAHRQRGMNESTSVFQEALRTLGEGGGVRSEHRHLHHLNQYTTMRGTSPFTSQPPVPLSGSHPCFDNENPGLEHRGSSCTTIQGQAIPSQFPSSSSPPRRLPGFWWLCLIPSCFRAGRYLLGPCRRKDRTTSDLA